MVKPYSVLTASLLLSPFISQASDIFVTELSVTNGHTQLSKSLNITKRLGYDNQPMFSSDSSGLFYTAMFTKGEHRQTDSMYYSFESGKTKNVTRTDKFSEYSPTPIDNGSKLSMIFVDESGSQKLWQTTIATGEQSPINTDIEPVGYHAWGKNNELLLFVLGEEMMLQYLAEPAQSKAELITKNIGRSLRYNQSKDLFTFTKGKDQQVLHSFDSTTKKVTELATLPNGSAYYTWLNDDIILSASGSSIYYWNYSTNNNDNSKNWQLLANLSSSCDTEITRLAVAPDQSKLAYVCEEK